MKNTFAEDVKSSPILEYLHAQGREGRVLSWVIIVVLYPPFFLVAMFIAIAKSIGRIRQPKKHPGKPGSSDVEQKDLYPLW